MARQVIYDQGGSLSTIDGLLKEDYVMEKIVNTVNMATYMLSQLTEEKTTAGRRYIFPVQFGVSQGQGSRGENQPLPSEGFGEYEQAMGNVRYQYGPMYITGQSIEATEGNKASFASALKQSLKDVRDGFKWDTQRQVWGDGTGTVARVDGVVTDATTIPVTDPYGLEYDGAALENSQKIRNFHRNMKLYFVGADEVRTVTGVNGDGTITVDSAVTLSDGDQIVRGDATGQTSADKEIEGISKFVSATGEYLGIPRAGLPEWQANLLQLDGSLSEEDMQIAFDTADINGTDEPDLLVTEHKARRIYVNLLTTQKRFVSPMDLEGGFKAIEYNGKPLVTDKYAPPQRIYYLRLADICWFTMKKINWINRDGTVLKWVNNRDAYIAILAAYRNLACKKPANQTVLENILT